MYTDTHRARENEGGDGWNGIEGGKSELESDERARGKEIQKRVG